MKILVTGCPRRTSNRSRGFTLIEVLIVLLIIALVGSVVALSVDSGSQSYEMESASRLFKAIAKQAAEEAELTGLDHGLTIEPVRDDFNQERYEYRWWRRSQEPLYAFFAGDDVTSGVGGPDRRVPQAQWETLDDLLYKSRQLPPGIELTASVADVPVDFRRRRPSEDVRKVDPLIIFYASGEATPASVEWIDKENEESLWRFQWDLFGQLEFEIRGELEAVDER
jgi:type II secretion system protein H